MAIAAFGASLNAGAADLAVLRNGNSIRHERRQILGPVTRLYLSSSSSGYIEIPTEQIVRFEVDDAPAVRPAPAAAAPAKQTPSAATGFFTNHSLNEIVNGAGERHQIDPDFINSVIRAESGFHPNAVSKKGARGLMQLMPGTASQLGVKNPFDPNANVEGGTRYLRELLERYNYDAVKALAAYNAGPRSVDRYRGVPPYYETQAYITRIIRDFNRKKLAANPALTKRPAAGAQHSVKVSSATAAKSQARPAPNLNAPAAAPASKTATTSVSKGLETASR
ncbi:MAG TPA: lytic transglycosylase domain-containing protein [Terriglobales bacterium]|nr:lytic transglycosylase domain-containing protein [Terriglobales bacterium]